MRERGFIKFSTRTSFCIIFKVPPEILFDFTFPLNIHLTLFKRERDIRKSIYDHLSIWHISRRNGPESIQSQSLEGLRFSEAFVRVRGASCNEDHLSHEWPVVKTYGG